MDTIKISGQVHIVLKQGDITKESADIIVNAANSSILGGGGVDGAIHRVAGEALLKECQKLRESQHKAGLYVGCKTGDAVITRAGNLKAKHIIHAVGPDMRQNLPNGAELLKKVYQKSLQLAVEQGANSIVFPSISTGIYSYPIQEAANVALKTVAEFLQTPCTLKEVRFVLFTQEDYKVYQKALQTLESSQECKLSWCYKKGRSGV